MSEAWETQCKTKTGSGRNRLFKENLWSVKSFIRDRKRRRRNWKERSNKQVGNGGSRVR